MSLARVKVSLLFTIDWGLTGPLASDIDEKAQKVPESVEKTLFSCGNAVNAHVWAQSFRDEDGPVGLLKILNDRNPSAPHGNS